VKTEMRNVVRIPNSSNLLAANLLGEVDQKPPHLNSFKTQSPAPKPGTANQKKLAA